MPEFATGGFIPKPEGPHGDGVPFTAPWGVAYVNLCPCGRMTRNMSWLCRCCYLEKEIGYAVSELERGGDAWGGKSWAEFGLERLKGLFPAGDDNVR